MGKFLKTKGKKEEKKELQSFEVKAEVPPSNARTYANSIQIVATNLSADEMSMLAKAVQDKEVKRIAINALQNFI